MNWVAQNLGTILVGAIVLAAVAAVIAYMRKKRKMNPRGGHCGCGCSSCPMEGDCPSRPPRD